LPIAGGVRPIHSLGAAINKSSLFARLKLSLAESAGDVVFGMEDGTVSIFGLVFGVAATTADNTTVLIAGASGAVAAAVSMMAGTYLDIETSRDAARVSASAIDAEMRQNPAAVVERVMDRLRPFGVVADQSGAVASFLCSEPVLLKSVASALVAPASAGSEQSPLVHALWMLVADFLAAAIPIIPFVFLSVSTARVVSASVTLLLLAGLGIGRARIGGRGVIRTVIETISIGVAAALAGVGIGVMISRLAGL
jgi:VIT1/CCC1 family predicted Fe2+/Mn2+ transporter